MIVRNNMVAHYCRGKSDKVYLACVRQDGEDWLVIGKWCRRGKTMMSSVKMTTQSETMARMEQGALFRSKLKEGYEDIDSGSYSGLVSRRDAGVAENLEPEMGTGKTHNQPGDPTTRSKKPRPVKPESTEGMVAICVNLYGIEDLFDDGIEYVFEPHVDQTMIWVYDKFGEKREYFKERFRLVKES